MVRPETRAGGMIEQQGKVVSISEGFARIRLGGMTGCPSCDEGKGCGAGLFGRMLRRKPVELDLENHIGARVGQGVMVGVSEPIYLALVARFYLLPLSAGLLGAGAAFFLSGMAALGPAAADILSLAAGIGCAAITVARNRKIAMEFPQKITVHLLRTV